MPKRWTYPEVAEDLATKIQAGVYPPGSPIPSYQQIAAWYSIHRTTAAKAVAVLRIRGLVEGSPGRGVFVVEDT